MTSQFQNYVPVQGLAIAGAQILIAQERISESSQIISPTANTETITATPQVTIT